MDEAVELRVLEDGDIQDPYFEGSGEGKRDKNLFRCTHYSVA